mmetsp:Transcript_72396/g.125515  ORF Transcript_72396/g.125515 Transcript_72396/m.125515 type:complete len:171 (-) Transcript_72396:7-519(-)
MNSAVLLPATLFLLFALTEGGNVNLKWSDCGGAHGKTTGLTPDSLPLGKTTRTTGTATIDEAVSGGAFEIDLKAEILHETYSGDLCSGKSFPLPLDTGSIKWDGVKCPVASGPMTVPIDLQLSSSIPTALQRVTITVKTTDSNKNSLLCMQIQTSPGDSLDLGNSSSFVV